MGYKLLGFIVWRGGMWYIRRNYPNLQRNLIIGGVVTAGAVSGAVVVSQRSRSS